MNPQSSPTLHSTALTVAGWLLVAPAVTAAVAAASGGSAVPFARVLALLALVVSLGLLASLLWLPVAGWSRLSVRLPMLASQPLPFARSELLSGGASALDQLRSPMRRRLFGLGLALVLLGAGVTVLTSLWPQPQPVTIALRSGDPVDHGETSDGARPILVQLPFALAESGAPDAAVRRVSVTARDIKTGTKSTLEVTPTSSHSLRGGLLRLAAWSGSSDIASVTVLVGAPDAKAEPLVLPFGKPVAWREQTLTLREGRSDFFGATGLAVAVEVASLGSPARVVWVFSAESGAAMAGRAPVVGPPMVVQSAYYDPVILLRWTPDASSTALVLCWVGAVVAALGLLLLWLLPPFVVGRDGDYLVVGVRGGRGAAQLAFAASSMLSSAQVSELDGLLADMQERT
ncbi:MAG: hypothetical protein HQ461_13165 [Deltaproteobacteria bacterium]|nr:hypothetical protein [Deltaproteobacteria bacterium]